MIIRKKIALYQWWKRVASSALCSNCFGIVMDIDLWSFLRIAGSNFGVIGGRGVLGAVTLSPPLPGTVTLSPPPCPGILFGYEPPPLCATVGPSGLGGCKLSAGLEESKVSTFGRFFGADGCSVSPDSALRTWIFKCFGAVRNDDGAESTPPDEWFLLIPILRAVFSFRTAAASRARELSRRRVTNFTKAAALMKDPDCPAFLARRYALNIIRGITDMIGRRQAPSNIALFHSNAEKSEDVSKHPGWLNEKSNVMRPDARQ
jgi:hypothetical protein